MEEKTIENLHNEIVEDLTGLLGSEPDFNEAVLNVKVKMAIREVRQKRNYEATTYDEEHIAEDLWNYYAVIFDVALYDYNMIGSEGEKSHSENGVSRSYESREKLFNPVHPFVRLM